MFNDKTILITGASSGIGRATALLMAKDGGKIVVADINEEGGEETVKMIKGLGGEAIFIQTDVTIYSDTENMVAKTIAEYGSLDVAINNAGVGCDLQRTDFFDHKLYHKIIAVNQTGVFYCMQHELRQMARQNAGVVVNVSSMAGLRAQPFASAYVASKHAVLGFTKTAALEFARLNIRVNAVCPVFTETPMVDKLLDNDPTLENKLLRNIPLRRLGKADEIAKAIAFLASDASPFSTGLCLPIDGGMSA